MNEYRDFVTPLKNPSSAYGEVPFYWWTGGKLDKARLTEQLTLLAQNGVAGVQINYAHHYKGGPEHSVWGGHGRSIKGDPEQFSEDWWEMFTHAAHECERLNMGIGVGDYTIAWIGNGYYTDKLASTHTMRAYELACEKQVIFSPDEIAITPELLAVVTYENGDFNKPVVLYDRQTEQNRIPYGCTQCFIIRANPVENAVNPMAKDCGKMLTDIYFKEFERRIPNLKKGTLNYFFQDELMFGCNVRLLWHPDLATEVKKQYGYDLVGYLPHLFEVLSPLSAKIRLNVQDVKTRLIEERYFMPIYEFHASRQMLYGCDQSSRGKEPDEFSDYFRTVRWFTAPGNDTPGRAADLIKVKVNSSIAHLYNRPRTWLEAYHSSGWGTTLESITAPTGDNFIFGANLLNLHGLYYTTNGGFFEWAPPDFHFRMPYWQHEKHWLDKYKSMSAMLTTGVHRCNVSVLYPVSSCDYGENAEACVNSTFSAAQSLFSAGLDFDFIDHQSVQNAVVKKSELHVAGESYRAVVLCGVDAVRYSVVTKLKDFAEKGGVVVFKDITPYISDRAGSEDVWLQSDIKAILQHENCALVNSDDELLNFLNRHMTRSFLPDLTIQKGKVYVNCRQTQTDKLFFVRYAEKDSVCRFEATGKPYLLNPYTKEVFELTETVKIDPFTFVKMPLEANEDTFILFTDLPVEANGEINTAGFDVPEGKLKLSLNGEWDFELIPTLDNRYGDFFEPSSGMIGAQARFFDVKYVNSDAILPKEFDIADCAYNTDLLIAKIPTDSPCEVCRKVSQPGEALPENAEKMLLDARYGFVAHGFEGDDETQKLEQGYHGLKGIVHDDNMIFTQSTAFVYQVLGNGTPAYLRFSGIVPDAVYLNGEKIEDYSKPVSLLKGLNRLAAAFIYNENKIIPVRNEGRVKHAGVYLTKTKAPRQNEIKLAKCDFLNGDYYTLLPFEHQSDLVCLHFIAPPGFKGFSSELAGELTRAVCGNEDIKITANGSGAFDMPLYSAFCRTPVKTPSDVYLFVKPFSGKPDTMSVVRPIDLICETGKIKPCDWSKVGVLKNYSGQALYKTVFSLPALSLDERAELDLGEVCATASVKINNREVYTFTYAPFKCDITAYLVPGMNTIEVRVANTLCNHYANVPSRYSNFPRDARSGLIGPVGITVLQYEK